MRFLYTLPKSGSWEQRQRELCSRGCAKQNSALRCCWRSQGCAASGQLCLLLQGGLCAACPSVKPTVLLLLLLHGEQELQWQRLGTLKM